MKLNITYYWFYSNNLSLVVGFNSILPHNILLGDITLARLKVLLILGYNIKIAQYNTQILLLRYVLILCYMIFINICIHNCSNGWHIWYLLGYLIYDAYTFPGIVYWCCIFVGINPSAYIFSCHWQPFQCVRPNLFYHECF